MTRAGSAERQLDHRTADLAPGTPGVRASTLLEIIVVMGLLLLLAGMVMSYTSTFTRGCGCSPTRKCGNNGRQIALAMQVYANDYDGVWPCD